MLLVAASYAPLPGTPAFEVVRIDEPEPEKHASHQNSFMKAVSTARNHLAAEPSGLLARTHTCLAARGAQPAAYILNQSSLADRSVSCPQIVAAWSYPVSLLGYLRKTPLLAPNKTIKAFVRTFLSGVGWWRMDWRGYRTADGVLPVTDTLLKSLRSRSVSAYPAYPGTCVGPLPDRSDGGIRLLMAAVRLNEPRKRILWMLGAMKNLSSSVGNRPATCRRSERVRSTSGRPVWLPRGVTRSSEALDLQKVMRQSDIFCFGSLLDDWGCVLVEAMANGMVPVAPAISPFDEIMGDAGYGYHSHSQGDFVCALRSAISGSLAERRRAAWDRAHGLFSREAFGDSILKSVESVTRLRCVIPRES